MDKKERQKLHKRDSAKATVQEALCLKEFREHIAKDSRYTLIDTWRTIRTGFRTKEGRYVSHSNDFMHDFDLCLAYSYANTESSPIQVLFFIQVKSHFVKKDFLYWQSRWSNSIAHCYAAYYGKVPKKMKAHDDTIFQPEHVKLPHFVLIRI